MPVTFPSECQWPSLFPGLNTEGTNWCKQTNTESLTDGCRMAYEQIYTRHTNTKTIKYRGTHLVLLSFSFCLITVNLIQTPSQTHAHTHNSNKHKVDMCPPTPTGHQSNEISRHGGLPWAHLHSNPEGIGHTTVSARACVFVHLYASPFDSQRGNRSHSLFAG